MLSLEQLAYFPSSFYQVGYVVPDIDKAQAYFRAALGVPRFFIMKHAPILDQTFLGKPAVIDQHVGFAYAGAFNIEIIQPVSGDSTYSRFLESRPGGGVHHVGLKVPSYDRAIADMKASGFEVLQTGRFGAGTKFAYLDTDKAIGTYTEIFYWDEEAELLFAKIRANVF